MKESNIWDVSLKATFWFVEYIQTANPADHRNAAINVGSIFGLLVIPAMLFAWLGLEFWSTLEFMGLLLQALF